MKVMMEWVATVGFVVVGMALLVMPAHAANFVPTRFTVVDEGTAGKPDVLLIPGLASSRAVWDGEAKLLAPKYRLHLLQVDGFAGAPAGANATGTLLPAIVEEVHAYIEAGTMQPIVIGHSLGGLLTLMLADKYPQDVRKMVIVDSLPFYGLVFSPDATVEMVQPQAAVIQKQMLAMPDDQFAMMQSMMAGALVTDAEGKKLVEQGSITSSRAVLVEAMYEDLQTDIRKDMAKIKKPTLLLYPYDPALQKDEAKYDAVYKNAYASMPNVTLVRIDGSRHFIMYDQPEKMNAAIEAFLK
jgi:pimeloyl-ACP methyl ester carboxylesterase